MKKRLVKKSEVLKEGYLKGLQTALEVIEEALNVDDLMKKVDDYENRSRNKADADLRNREQQIMSYIKYAKENKESFAALIKLAHRLLQSRELRHLVTNHPNNSFGKDGFRTDACNHWLGFYITDKDYKTIMIGVMGGGQWGPIDLAVDEEGDIYVRECEKEYPTRLTSQIKKYVTNESLFKEVSIIMKNYIYKLDQFERKIEEALK